jgi:hypothetical protein
VHSGLKHKFCIFLHTEGFLNAPKDSHTSFGVQWSTMDAFGAKSFSQLRHTEHKFSIFLHVQEFLNSPKHNQTSFLGQMEYNQCIWRETIFATSVLQSSGFRLEIHVLHLLHVEGFLNAPKHKQTSFWVY